MDTYTAQMETPIGNGLHTMQLQKNRKQGLRSGPIPFATLTIFVLALSVVFPYGLGVAVIAWVIALAGALLGVGYATYVVLKESLGKTGTFGYSPAAAYLAGKRTKKSATGRKS
ncbi:MAG: hypothetical protein M0R70_06835 [Nitrospirae bacterium]|nr:hypothetical protein [Nitrospirota bacterium]